MRQQELEFSEFRKVWMLALFDLPMNTIKGRRDYVKFRKVLLNNGFIRLQFSVYARYCTGEDSSKAFRRRIRTALPPEGEVRLLHVTDHQFAKMEVFTGKKPENPEEPPPQILLF